MRKKFRGRKKIQTSKIFKIILIILVAFFLYKLFNIKFKLKMDNNILKYILNENNYSSNLNIYKKIIDNTCHDVINNPTKILAINNNEYSKKENIKIVNNTLKDKEDKPIVYLYNSHQTESYTMDYMEDYNINPDVLLASHMMKERLDNIGIYTIVEEASIKDYLKNNDLKYYQSYIASRYYLQQVMEKYDSIKLFIDIHRDAVTHEISTTRIDDKDYAKIMFVVGLEHDNYLNNLENAKKLNEMIKNKYPQLTRGVLEKEGKNVNGIYNQDLGSNIMLIEIGGNYNNIVEVMNTIDVITPIIGEYINETK